ncbi:MAG: hypothetical protein II839_13505 [Kiritimatiellae bacterium]|nr:hypothetical protein [Kiritimatiellia bacterium]
MKRITLLLALLTAGLCPGRTDAAAPVTLAPMFRDHAVLQRDVPLPIWGTAEPGMALVVRLDEPDHEAMETAASPVSSVVDADGRWRAELPARPAGGPFTLRVDYAPAGEAGATIALGDASAPDSAGAVAEDILIGDVWLCSGQSNMDMNYGWGLTRGKEDIETNVHARIRLFDDRNRTALSPQRDLPDDYGWTTCDPAHAKSFSAVGYFFGQALQEAMPDVPIGLVEASWSGSPIKTWIPYEAAEALGGDFGKQAADRRAIAEAWENGGAEQFQIDLAAWMDKLPAIDPGDAPAAPDFDDSDWQTAKLPEITEKHTSPDFDGWVWYRKTFVIEKDKGAVGEVSLSLGPVDDQDWTYVNGVLVGTTNAWDASRQYVIPAGTLHVGTNVVAVKVLDWGGHSGLWTKDASALAIHGSWRHCRNMVIDGHNARAMVRKELDIPLAGEWKFKAFPAEPRPVDPSSPSSWDIAACHNGMVAPLFGMAAKGAIWYQGCSDVGNADLYAKQFPAMVGAWREGFVHDGAGFPVYLVQLAAFKETHAEPLDSAWARMRWTQMQLGETVPHCGTAVAIDVGAHGDIHPKDKKTVGERLAALALAQTYGREGRSLSPVPSQASYDWASGHVTIQFVDPVSRKPAKLREDFGLRGFEVSVDGGDWKWAEKSFVNEKMFPDTVFVEGQDGVHTNVCVRYAWDDYPDCNLVSADGLPVGPFELKAKILDLE